MATRLWAAAYGCRSDRRTARHAAGVIDREDREHLLGLLANLSWRSPYQWRQHHRTRGANAPRSDDGVDFHCNIPGDSTTTLVWPINCRHGWRALIVDRHRLRRTWPSRRGVSGSYRGFLEFAKLGPDLLLPLDIIGTPYTPDAAAPGCGWRSKVVVLLGELDGVVRLISFVAGFRLNVGGSECFSS